MELGTAIDRIARARLRNWLRAEIGGEDPSAIARVNRWLRDPAGTGAYRIPDARSPAHIFDLTIGAKLPTTPQILDLLGFSPGSRVTVVVPVIRTQLGEVQMAWVDDEASLCDFISYVLFYAPDKFPVEDYLPESEQMNLERAFVELRHGIQYSTLIRNHPDERATISELLERSLDAYRTGESNAAFSLLRQLETRLGYSPSKS